MPVFINHPREEGTKTHERWNYVDCAVLARQIELLESALDGYELNKEQSSDAAGLKRLLKCLQNELRIEGNVVFYTYEG
jgi:hypothetical protein